LSAPSAIGSADGSLPKEDVMKRMMVGVLSLCACASISRASASDALSGTWRGAVRKGALESVVWLEFARTDAGYRGSYFGTTPPGERIALNGIEFGHSVRFEVPQIGVFDGEISGDTMEGTFVDAQGGGSFRVDKQAEWDALSNGP
jgi:hypothetical protein